MFGLIYSITSNLVTIGVKLVLCLTAPKFATKFINYNNTEIKHITKIVQDLGEKAHLDANKVQFLESAAGLIVPQVFWLLAKSYDDVFGIKVVDNDVNDDVNILRAFRLSDTTSSSLKSMDLEHLYVNTNNFDNTIEDHTDFNISDSTLIIEENNMQNYNLEQTDQNYI